MRQALDTWRGRPLTEAEARRFDLERLLGVNAMLLVAHETGTDGKTWARITTIAPLPAGAARLAPEGYVRQKDRPPTNGTHPPAAPLPVEDVDASAAVPALDDDAMAWAVDADAPPNPELEDAPF